MTKMIKKYRDFHSSQKAAFIVLQILVIVNAIWAVVCQFLGPLIALLTYAFLTYLFLGKNDFMAGIIIGILGFLIHAYELIFQGLNELGEFEKVFFFINLIFAIILIYFSYKAYKEIKRHQ